MIPARTRLADDPQLREQLENFIMRRDRGGNPHLAATTRDDARRIVNAMTDADLTILEIELRDRAPTRFESDYDPLGR